MLLAVGCTGAIGTLDDAERPPATVATGGERPATPEPPPLAATFTPAAGGLRRLTAIEYRNTIVDLVGQGVPLPTALEADLPKEGFTTIGAALDPLSPRGVEQYGAAARQIAEAIIADTTRRSAVVGCAPASLGDRCVRRFVQTFGRRDWRRLLTDEEVYAELAIAVSASMMEG